MNDYWRECIAEAFEESKIVATDEQIDNVASWAESAHDNYSQAFGLDVASKNLQGTREREIADLKRELGREQAKIMCRTCNGTGLIISHGPVHSSSSQCWKCNGSGRHSV